MEEIEQKNEEIYINKIIIVSNSSSVCKKLTKYLKQFEERYN